MKEYMEVDSIKLAIKSAREEVDGLHWRIYTNALELSANINVQ